MKHLALLLLLAACGKADSTDRCRSAEEAQLRCQVDYAELYEAYEIPGWVKEQCRAFYPAPGCYLESSKRESW